MTNMMLYVFIGWFFGGFVGGAAGFGGMMMALPILSMVMPASEAVLISCITGAPGSTQLAWLYRKYVVWSDMKWLWIGCIPGCVLGAFTLKIVPVHYLQMMISIMIGCFVILQILQKHSSWKLSDSIVSLIVAGMASGFANSSVSVVGVPISIFILLKQWDRDRARGTMGMLFFLSGWITLASQWYAGLYSMNMIPLAITGIIASFLGQIAGFKAGRYLNQKIFVRFVLLFLICAAGILFYKALQLF